MDLEALALTLRLAASTTAILMLVGLPLAWLIARGTGPLVAARPSSTLAATLRSTLQAIVALPLVLPPTVLGFYLLVALGPRTSLGRLLIHLVGHPLAFSFAGLLVGSCLYSLPFAVQPLVAALRSLDQPLLETAAALGILPSRTLREIVLPAIRPSLLTAAVLTFTHTIGEFGVVLMLGGNIPGSTQTLSISIYNLVEGGRDADANRTALLLVAFSLTALLLLYVTPALRRRPSAEAPLA